jgi:hypothetical protein
MRTVGLVIILGAMSLVAARAQELENITSISFSKQTRGYVDEVVISRDSVEGFIENDRVPENSKHYAADVNDDDWTKLILALKDVPLKDIDGLQSPTTNRAHDGAIHSSIVIMFDDGNSISHSFDDENPHPDLQPLLDAIMQFRLK